MSVAQLVECTRGGGGTVRDAVVAKTVKTQHVPLKGVNGKQEKMEKQAPVGILCVGGAVSTYVQTPWQYCKAGLIKALGAKR